MTSIQERLQMKREPLDKWSLREQLCLASAVARSGDQNWMSVSRALKPFGEPNRPPDWFHQKNCAAQYGMLLGNVETPKRKKRTSVEAGVETPAEHILKKLLTERQNELKKLLAEEKSEYQKLQEDMLLLQSGKVTEEQLDKWCKDIDEEEHRKEQEAQVHLQWLKEREQRKLELERAWRPARPTAPIGQKRKNSDSLDSFVDEQPQMEEQQQPHASQESVKPALSPLLTSLLKSPSQVQTTSMLHTTMTNRHTPTSNTSPMIASLLNSSTGVTVSPGLQQLVSTAIGQEISNVETTRMEEQQQPPITNDILDDASLPNIKIDDLASSILVQDGPLPEIKKEEVDDIISEIIENAQDIVADPEQHLELDGNGDININLELDDLDEEEIPESEGTKDVVTATSAPPPLPLTSPTEYTKGSPQEAPIKEEDTMTNSSISTPPPSASTAPVVDPFEFREDPVIFDTPLKNTNGKPDTKQHVPLYQQQTQPALLAEEKEEEKVEGMEIKKEETDMEEEKIEIKEEEIKEEPVPGSVEIVEVVVMDEEEMDKELDKTQIQDIVHSSKSDVSEDTKSDSRTETEEEKPKTETEESSYTPESKDTANYEESSEASDTTTDTKKDPSIILDVQDSLETTTIVPDFSEDLYDELSMEVKVDKTGKAKRDYSRMKKKEEHGFDMLLAIEKAHLDCELTEEVLSDATTDTEKKEGGAKGAKSLDEQRSNSPWTEEEDDTTPLVPKRRQSTPATPVDSVPNSPASGTTAYFDDDREYKNWKKSVMLVYNRLATNKYASLFLKPITEDQAPGYSGIVYRPMDLLTIKKNIDNGSMRNTHEFKRDTMLMFTNAMMYNKTNDTIYNMALQMQQESLQPIEILMQATSQGDAPLRRETRTSESGSKRKRTVTEETVKTKKRKED